MNGNILKFILKYNKGKGKTFPYTQTRAFITQEMSWRPWTQAASRLRALKGHKRNLPDPVPQWKIVRGDLVC